MPNVTVTNLTRNAVSLPGSPPYTITDRQQNGASMVDTILAPFQSKTINVGQGELARVRTFLQPQINAGVLRVSVAALDPGIQENLQESSAAKTYGHDSFVIPLAGNTSLSGGAVGGNISITPGSGLTQLDVPRNCQVTYASSWNGGNIAITGTLVDGTSYTEIYPVPVTGIGTVVGSAGFVTLQIAVNLGTRTLGTVNVLNGLKLALSRRNLSSVIKESINVPGVSGPADEAVGTVDLANGTILPTTPADATHSYDFYYV